MNSIYSPVKKQTAKEINTKLSSVEPEQIEVEQLPEEIKFWYAKTKEDEAGNVTVKDVCINYLKFTALLYAIGFRRFDIDKSHIFIKVENTRIVRQVTRTEITDAFCDHLDSKPQQLDDLVTRDYLKEKIYRSINMYFNEEKLYRLKSKEEIVFNEDSRDTKFFYYQNGFLEVSKTGIEFKPFAKLEKFIWKSEILKRDYKKPDAEKAVFEMFLEKVCYSETDKDSSRFLCLKIMVGYLLHHYTQCKLKAVLLTDSRISDEGEANGRTGKTLFCKGIGSMISANPEDPTIKTFCDINAKDFDPKEKHKYQLAGYETRIICLNDLRRNFDVDCIYNDVTEGVSVEPKGMTPFRIRPKMILTTNKTVKIEGDSSKDRFIEFEFSDFFSKNHSPEDEFQHWFFRDWDSSEWNRFDYFMCQCVHEYFKNDCKLREPEQINLNTRKLHETTCPEFVEFMEMLLGSKQITIADTEYREDKKGWFFNKKELFGRFRENYTDYNNDKFKQKKFSEWLKNFTRYKEGFEPFKKELDEFRNDKDSYIRFRRTGSSTEVTN